MGVTTAVAFDKLSEVRKTEEDSLQRSEQREEERKQREKQLMAVKNTSKPYIHRRTLRRAIEFYSNVPVGAYKMVGGQRTEWHRSISSPAGDVGEALGKSLLKKMKSFRLSSGSDSDHDDVQMAPERRTPTPPPEQPTEPCDSMTHSVASVVSLPSLERSQSEPLGTDRSVQVEAMDAHLGSTSSNRGSGSVDMGEKSVPLQR